MANSPVYANDAVIPTSPTIQNPYYGGSVRVNNRQQDETSDIYLTSMNRGYLNRTETIDQNSSRRERRKKHAISQYDENNYALAGPVSRNSSVETIDQPGSNKSKCYLGNFKKRWIFLIALLISLACAVIIFIITASSKSPVSNSTVSQELSTAIINSVNNGRNGIFGGTSEVPKGSSKVTPAIPPTSITNLPSPPNLPTLPPLPTNIPPPPPEVPPNVPPSNPSPSKCPTGFKFERGFSESNKNTLSNFWTKTSINECAEDCKKSSKCNAIEWSQTELHCLLLSKVSVNSDYYEDYIQCSGIIQ